MIFNNVTTLTNVFRCLYKNHGAPLEAVRIIILYQSINNFLFTLKAETASFFTSWPIFLKLLLITLLVTEYPTLVCFCLGLIFEKVILIQPTQTLDPL